MCTDSSSNLNVGVGQSSPREIESETEMEAEAEALERLARAGHWQRCLAHSGRRAPHYALRYVTHLFKTHSVRITRVRNYIIVILD